MSETEKSPKNRHSPNPVLPPAARELLDGPTVAHISTVTPAGRPQASIVWVERRGDELVLFSRESNAKVRNLRNNPRIDVVLVDPDRQLLPGIPCYLRLTGTAEVRDAEEGIPDRIARIYGHEKGYPGNPGKLEELVNIHITVERYSGMGPFGNAGDSADSWRED